MPPFYLQHIKMGSTPANDNKHGTLWVSPQRRIEAPDKELVCCTSKSRLKENISEAIQQWLYKRPSEEVFFIAIDGISGAGKTSLKETIRDIVDKINGRLSFCIIPVDLFIATDRDSPLRKIMLTTPELFWRLIYSRQELIRVLSGVSEADGVSRTFSLPQIYYPEIGKVGSGALKIPGGKKIVVVEGINSIDVLDQLRENGNFSAHRIIVFTSPEDALKRAVRRDIRDGRTSDAEARYDHRAAEYKFQIPQIYGANSRRADIIVGH